MADPSAETFYCVGDPGVLDFGSTDGMTEQVEIAGKFTISDPAHVAQAEKYVTLGILSKTPPSKPKAEVS